MIEELKEWLHASALVVAATVVVLVALLLSGCTLMQAKSYDQMSPEQMKALNDMHIDVYSCITVAGPPPSGKFVYVLVPRLDKKPDVRFGENCAIR